MPFENEKLSLEYRTGLTADDGFLDDVYEIDKQVYSPVLCGDIKNLYKRYKKCPDSYVLLYFMDRLVGYISVLNMGDELYNQMNDPSYHGMRDDDIMPEELDDWKKDEMNHLFILSVAIIPGYRDGNVIKVLGNKFLEFLRDKENNGYKIGSLAGSAVSDGGERFLRRFRGEYIKDLEHGYRYIFADRKNIEELLKNGLLLKNV